MVRLAVEHSGLAGATCPFRAGRQHPHARFLDDRQDGTLRGHREGQLAALKDDLERLPANGFGLGFRREPLQVQGPGRPAGGVRLDRRKQRLE